MALMALKRTPGPREQRFCSSSQVVRYGFYIPPPGHYSGRYYSPTQVVGIVTYHGPPVTDACDVMYALTPFGPTGIHTLHSSAGIGFHHDSPIPAHHPSALAQGGRRPFPASFGGGEWARIVYATCRRPRTVLYLPGGIPRLCARAIARHSGCEVLA